MASRRQIKKNKNKALEKQINTNMKKLISMQEKFNLEGSGLQEELMSVGEAVSDLQRLRKNRGQVLKEALEITEKQLERENELIEIYHRVKSDERKASGASEEHNNGLKWSYIKEYHDLVNDGLITPWRTEQQVYDEAPFLLDDVLSEDHLREVVQRGRQKAQKLLEKNRQRQSKIVAFDW